MKYKIVADSSSNLFQFAGMAYDCVPLKIISPAKEYADTPLLDLDGMIEDLKHVKGPTGTSCPNVHEWAQAYEGADYVFAVTLTSNLSGSCSAALQAAQDLAHVHVIDTLSVGPEMELVMEHLREGVGQDLDFETLKAGAAEYLTHTHLFFSLESLTNLARNGRVSPAVAKLAGVLGIRIMGQASAQGTLELMHKCRGEKKVLATLWDEMCLAGYKGGKVRIRHCRNEAAARELQATILRQYPLADVCIGSCTALCSFYAEQGGLLIGFEDL